MIPFPPSMAHLTALEMGIKLVSDRCPSVVGYSTPTPHKIDHLARQFLFNSACCAKLSAFTVRRTCRPPVGHSSSIDPGPPLAL